jgi:transcriptional regulator with XRE-family HTH domain
MGRAAHFDGQAFYAALDAHRQAKDLSWRQVADQTGVSASTLTRMAQGRLPDVEGLAALSAWAGLDTDAFIHQDADRQANTEPATLAKISTHLRSDQRLSPESAKALEEIITVAYRRFRDAG